MLETLIHGLIPLNFIEYAIYTLVVTHITIVAITLYLHRGVCHSAIDIHPILSHFFRFWLWLTTSMRTADWVAIHRKHHAKVETSDDPHSPAIYGINKVILQGADLYHKEKNNKETIEKYSQNCPQDWIEEHVYTGRNNLGILLLFILNIILFGTVGIIIWSIQMMWTPIFAAGGINGAGHYWGYRNYNTNDDSTNMSPIGIIIGGEELHNNHHAYPTAAKFSLRPWEFDIGWMYIKIFGAIGLCKVKRIAPMPIIQKNENTDSKLIAQSLLQSKLAVITDYTQKVLKPAYQKEQFKLSFKLLADHPQRLNEHQEDKINALLENNSTLHTIYILKNRLHEILHSRQTKHEQFIETLNIWSNEAKGHGIAALDDFLVRLRSYKVI
jgi:stearoyl-CoA desaturase (delta-9 desaturase)